MASSFSGLIFWRGDSSSSSKSESMSNSFSFCFFFSLGERGASKVGSEGRESW